MANASLEAEGITVASLDELFQNIEDYPSGEYVGQAPEGVYITLDRWDGYQAERRLITRKIRDDRTFAAATIDGTSGPDTLRGYGGADTIYGGYGKDRILGGSGNDNLFGGPSRDRIFDGAGRDRVDADQGNDYVHVADGRFDSVSCGLGADDTAVVDQADLAEQSFEDFVRLSSCEDTVVR